MAFNNRYSEAYIDELDDAWAGFAFERDGSIGSIPTRVQRGMFRTFQFPIWQAGVSEEDLNFAMRIPFRWDGTTAPHIYFITAPTANETVGDKFKFQLQVQHADVGTVIPAGVCSTHTCEITCSTGKNAAYYAQICDFELTCGTMVSGQNLQCNLTRIASSGPEVAAEPCVLHWNTRWYFDKPGTESVSGY